MSYANWLGESTVSLPNNTLVIGGVPVNAVPIRVGSLSNVSSWSNGNFITYFQSPVVPAGTYLVGMEVTTNPLTASNVASNAGWYQGDYFIARCIDQDGLSTRAVQNFIRPYTSGIQVNATAPYNRGGTDAEAVGIVILSSNTTLVWQAQFGKDVATSFPMIRSLSIESPWYQRIA